MPIWIGDAVVLAIHDAQLAEHGGAAGVRDEGLLASALARPRTLAAYGEPLPDLAALAAAYAFGIVRNHGFVDGNKRTSLVVTETFLRLNGQMLTATDPEIVATWLALADGTLDEVALATWIRARV